MKSIHHAHFQTVDGLMDRFAQSDYVASEQIATIVFLAFNLEKPVLVEGPAGVGKTELAKSTAALLDVPLVRLQCYEGLDEAKALYEWKYGKQLLYTQLLRENLSEKMRGESDLAAAVDRLHAYDDLFYSEHFLRRP